MDLVLVSTVEVQLKHSGDPDSLLPTSRPLAHLTEKETLLLLLLPYLSMLQTAHPLAAVSSQNHLWVLGNMPV